MNPFHNPVFLTKVLKSYLFDVNRLHRLSPEQLQRYQDKQIRKMVRFAFTVPLYKEKYQAADLRPEDIRGLKDLPRLPLITKEDIQHYYPDGIISTTQKKEQLVQVETSGTTGKSLPLYVDMFTIVMGLFAYARTLREYGLSERKTKMTVIGDFATHTAESGYISRGLEPRFNITGMFRNIQWLNTNDDPKKLIEEMDRFQPEFIGGYVGMLAHLALLKEKGLGPHIHPQYIAATGSVLDPTLKKFIETSFQTHVFEAYGATESGLIGFQCSQGNYHIMSDLVHVEYVKNGEVVPLGETGKVVLTKLYGTGTPIIRYDAINDIVASSSRTCSCGMAGDLCEKIYGRDDLSLLLPGGIALLPTSFSEVYSKVLYDLKTNRLKNTRIIQHDLTTIEVQLVLDTPNEQALPSNDMILSFVQQEFQKIVGSEVTVTVKQVETIEHQGPRIVSHVDRSTVLIKKYR